MTIREAKIEDIKQIQIVRNSVTENTLSNPDLVTDQDCEEFITVRGKGWVCEIDKQIVGFAIADLKANNIWALFLDPNYEKKGIGQLLHKTMLDWYNTNAGLSGNDAKPANNVWANGPTRPAIVSYAKNKGKGALMNINAIGKTGGDLPHNNMMPFLALNYYINAGGYASQNKY